MKNPFNFIRSGKKNASRSNEAMSILDKYMLDYRNMSYDELIKLVDSVEAFEIAGPSGKTCNLEFMFWWDGPAGEGIRVTGAIDDQGATAFSPVTEDFIMTKDGQFVGGN